MLLGRYLASDGRGVREDPRPYAVVAVGKAAEGMLTALRRRLEAPCRQAVLVTPSAPSAAAPPSTTVLVAGHPVPTAASVQAGSRVLRLARGLGRDDRLIVLLSGGASALLSVPSPPVTLSEKVLATRLLLEAGASIHELNAVRKHLSSIKGGQLAAATRASVATFALSDVVWPVEDDASVIGSGPTVVDPSTFADALAVIERFGLRAGVPPAAVTRLERGARGEEPETPKRAE